MEHIAIVGVDYRDCKLKKQSLSSIKKAVKYTLVTKPKHLSGIPFSEVIETNSAKNNPHYHRIMELLSDKPKINEKPEEIVSREIQEESEIVETPQAPVDYDKTMPVDGGEDLPNSNMLEPDIEETSEPEKEISEEEPKAEEDVNEPITTHPEEEQSEQEVLPEDKILTSESEEDDEIFSPDDQSEEVDDEIFSPDDQLEEDIPQIVPEEEEEEIKPVGNPPKRWHARNEFIDEVGNIFRKGKYFGREIINE